MSAMKDAAARHERGLPLHAAARAAGVMFCDEPAPTDESVEVNGLRLHYLEWGDPAAPPFLMLHGMAQTAHSWDFSALAYCDRFRVIALDQRGHGDSAWAGDGDYSLDAQQRDLLAFVEALGLCRPVLMGLSMGGRNAYVFAADHPDHVAALVVVDSAPEQRRAGAETIRRFVQGHETGSFDDFLVRSRRYNPRRSEAQLRGSLLHNLKVLPDGRWTWKYDGALRSPGAVSPPGPEFAERLWGCVERVRCPTLLVRGANSAVLSHDVAEMMAARLSDGRLAVVEDAGHLVPGDNPAGFLRAVDDFLRDAGLSGTR